ncbi:hypothetical protein Q5H93_10805 [Hymenobacter sp. ASUV-10]|uniref:Uncharacterized protein n=1 Tax=Hymenobacter aranciens TaxID=3063996 RepID=A0ABT9BAK5_9BACT|nr:hypothetical protein [Hymenobacter sp. ASUV-10]MDO7875222.1 hypothetical protein [Hymenobacter sp. ASUV-10]
MAAPAASDRVLISIFADGDMTPFLLSTLGMALHILDSAELSSDLKDAVQARGLLDPAHLHHLLATGQALRQAVPEAENPDFEPPADNDDRPAWRLTMADVLAIVTANDFIASSFLHAFGDEARRVQVELNGVPAEVYDAHIAETLGYFARFQREWQELFGKYPAYQQRQAELAALRAEFVG